jgi:hypothetical protein
MIENSPKLLKTQCSLDFGKGFYTTTDFDQAKKWAIRTAKIREEGEAIVSWFELNDKELQNIKHLHFEKADSDWLDFVANNRKHGESVNDWDLISGPVANDQTFPTIILFLDGFLDAESTIRQLWTQKLKDQYTFKTEASLNLLRFIEAKRV